MVTCPLTVKFFLTGHIQHLARKFDLTLIGKFDDLGFLDHLNVPIRVISVGIERNISPLRDLLALFHLIRIFYREQFFLVHTFSPKSGLLAMMAAFVNRVPLRIHHFQGEVWSNKMFLLRFLLKNLDRLVVYCATHLLVVSESERTFLVEEQITTYENLDMLAQGSICGVDTELFAPNAAYSRMIREQFNLQSDDKIILFLGRLTYDKGIMDLVHAFSILANQYPSIHLMIVGPDENHLSNLIRDKFGALCQRIHFNDYTPHPEHFIAASDIFCLPSYREGFGLVLIEAAAMQVPTIGSRIYGIRDAVIDGETGLLFSPRQVPDLVAKIQILLDDLELARQLGLNGRERALKLFKKEILIHGMEAYYTQIGADPGSE